MSSDFSHIRLRPSLAPVVKQCPSAMYVDPKVPNIETTAHEVFSATGTALHAIFHHIIQRGYKVNEEALTPYLKRHNVVLEGYYGILWRARKIAEKWDKVKQWYQGAASEKRITCTLSNGYELGGTPDLAHVAGEFGLVFDLKTGEKDFDYTPQIELYALILYKRNQALGLKKVYAALFHPLLDRYRNEEISEERLNEIEARYVEAMSLAGVSYVLGPACALCPRLLTCPAMIKSVDPVAQDLQSGRELTGLDVKKFRPTMQYLKRVLESYEEVEKALVERMGSIDLGNGQELYQKTLMDDKLKPVETYKLLVEQYRIPSQKVLEGMKISKDAVKEAARAIAVPRSREQGLGVTQAKLLTALEEHGAIEKKPRKIVTTRPIPETITP